MNSHQPRGSRPSRLSPARLEKQHVQFFREMPTLRFWREFIKAGSPEVQKRTDTATWDATETPTASSGIREAPLGASSRWQGPAGWLVERTLDRGVAQDLPAGLGRTRPSCSCPRPSVPSSPAVALGAGRGPALRGGCSRADRHCRGHGRSGRRRRVWLSRAVERFGRRGTSRVAQGGHVPCRAVSPAVRQAGSARALTRDPRLN